MSAQGEGGNPFRPYFTGRVAHGKNGPYIAHRDGRPMAAESRGFAFGYNQALEDTDAAGLLRWNQAKDKQIQRMRERMDKLSEEYDDLNDRFKRADRERDKASEMFEERVKAADCLNAEVENMRAEALDQAIRASRAEEEVRRLRSEVKRLENIPIVVRDMDKKWDNVRQAHLAWAKNEQLRDALEKIASDLPGGSPDTSQLRKTIAEAALRDLRDIGDDD